MNIFQMRGFSSDLNDSKMTDELLKILTIHFKKNIRVLKESII